MSIRSSYPPITPSLSLDFAKSRRLDPRISFTRAQTGNIATYTGSDGLIKYAGPDEPRFDHRSTFRTNYARYSEEFNNWIQTRVSVLSNNTTAPDGSNTADKIIEDSSLNNSHLVYLNNLGISSIPSVYVFSVYAKAAERSKILLRIDDSTPQQRNVSFDLATGTVTNTANSTGAIENIGNGWYRCINIMTSSVGVLNSVVQLINDSGSLLYDGDGSSGVYLWGAQLEGGGSVTDYIATGPAAVTKTSIESLGLLVEESRTNLITYSHEIDNTNFWSSARSYISANSTISPDGTQTADKLVEDTQTGPHHRYFNFSVVNGTTYTLSAFFKAAERSEIIMQFGNQQTSFPNSGTYGSKFNLSTGDIVSQGSNVERSSINLVGNGWYKCSITATALDTVSTQVFIAFLIDQNGNASYTGDNASGVYIWGAQLEVGKFPSSYIPTSGSAVNRPVDYVSISGTKFSNFFNPYKGTFSVKVNSSYGPPSGYPRFLMVTNSSNSQNDVIQQYYSNNTTSIGWATWRNGTPILIDTYSTSDGSSHFTSFAVDYLEENAKTYKNGIPVQRGVENNNNWGVPPLDRLYIGSIAGSIAMPQSHFKSLTYYPKRLSDSQLQILTTP